MRVARQGTVDRILLTSDTLMTVEEAPKRADNDENLTSDDECVSIRRCLLVRMGALLTVAALPARVARALVRVLLEAVRSLHVPAVRVAVHLRPCNRSFELINA